MNKFIPIIILFLISILGFFQLIYSRNNLCNKKDEVINFLNKFREFIDKLSNNNIDETIYQWLILNSAKIQQQINDCGIQHSYKPPFSNFIIKNYQLIINGIINIKNLYYENQNLMSNLLIQNLTYEERSIDNVILTYIGIIDNKINIKNKNIKNPIIYLREGIRLIITLPILLIYWSGLLQYKTYNILSNNFLFKFVSFIVGLAAFIDSIISITNGYAPFTNILKHYIGKN